jgi:hypothetical protein
MEGWNLFPLSLSPTLPILTSIHFSILLQVIDERLLERKSLVLPEEREVDEFTGKRKRRAVAFLDLLLDAYDDGQIDREGIREEVDTFMFEVSVMIIVMQVI